MIEKNFDSVDALLTYFLNALENAKKKEKENKFAPYDSSRIAHCGDHPFGSPVDLRRLEPSLVKRDTITVDKQQVIEGLFQ